MEKKSMIAWAIVLGMGGMISSCGIDIPKEEKTSFETMIVKKQDITVPWKFSAKMKGQSDVTITPQASGQLVKICIAEGQQVKKGQVLFEIDSRNARLNLESAQANLQAAIAQENSAKLEYESNKNLFDKKIVSSYVLSSSENSYKQAQASVAQARASVNSAKVNLGFCTITAPVTGVIGEIRVRPGDQVSPATQLTMLSGNTTMDAEFAVSEALIEAEVSAGLTKEDKMIGAKASFPNPDGHLFSGIQGTVVLPFAEKDVIVIPQTAVVKLQDKQQVYKVKSDSTATAVTVTTVDAGNGEDFIVTSGLNVGDKIVTIGANNVQEGQQVLFPEAPKKEK